jgi:RNA polymerase sigma-70 factor (sigma-E family)
MKTGFEDYARERGLDLLRAAYLLTGDRNDAEDLVQEVLLKVFRHWSKVSAAGNQDGYVHRMLVNQFLNGRRRRALPALPLSETQAEPAGDLEEGVVERDRVARALAELPPRERLAIVLRHYRGMSHLEIATAMGITESSARSATSRAAQTLREALDSSPYHRTRSKA